MAAAPFGSSFCIASIIGGAAALLVWTALPALLIIGLCTYAYTVLRSNEAHKANALTVNVTERQFADEKVRYDRELQITLRELLERGGGQGTWRGLLIKMEYTRGGNVFVRDVFPGNIVPASRIDPVALQAGTIDHGTGMARAVAGVDLPELPVELPTGHRGPALDGPAGCQNFQRIAVERRPWVDHVFAPHQDGGAGKGRKMRAA